MNATRRGSQALGVSPGDDPSGIRASNTDNTKFDGSNLLTSCYFLNHIAIDDWAIN